MPGDTDDNAVIRPEPAPFGDRPDRYAPSQMQTCVMARSVVHCDDTHLRPDLVIAIPVCNEIERIPACVDAALAPKRLGASPCAGLCSAMPCSACQLAEGSDFSEAASYLHA